MKFEGNNVKLSGNNCDFTVWSYGKSVRSPEHVTGMLQDFGDRPLGKAKNGVRIRSFSRMKRGKMWILSKYGA